MKIRANKLLVPSIGKFPSRHEKPYARVSVTLIKVNRTQDIPGWTLSYKPKKGEVHILVPYGTADRPLKRRIKIPLGQSGKTQIDEVLPQSIELDFREDPKTALDAAITMMSQIRLIAHENQPKKVYRDFHSIRHYRTGCG